jgi:hypothetical protein
MVDLECGEFVLFGTDVNTGYPRWRAQLTPAPLTREWQDAISSESHEARKRGVYLGEGGIRIDYTGDFMFNAPVGTEAAIAKAMREIVKNTNSRMAERRGRNLQYGRTQAALSGPASEATMRVWVDHLATSPPAALYHYTTQSGLLGIVTSKSLWATSVHRLADSTEYSGARQLGRARIAQAVASDTELAQHLRQGLDSIAGLYIYVCSFSEEGDLLSQWRAYGGVGGGASLGFDPIDLRAIAARQGFTLMKCIYGDGKALPLIDGLIQDAIEARRLGIPLDKIAQDFGGWFRQIAPAIKDRSFWEEREWRLVSFPKSFDDPRIRHREGDTLIKPFFEFDLLAGGGRLTLVDAYAGPTRHDQTLAVTTIGNFLRTQQVDCRGMRPTSTTFRP